MQSQQKQYEYLEHTADVKFLAYGKTLKEVFENAALAMFNVMIDIGKISEDVEKNIFLKSQDLESLIVDWLSEHLYIFEVDQIIFSKFYVDRIREENGEYSITSRASGEKYYPNSHPFETEIKAVTYYQLKIERIEDGWRAQVVLDI